MKAVLHVNHAEHQRTHVAWMAAGLRRHGIATAEAPCNEPAAADLVVVWGWRQQKVITAAQAAGVPVLVMERGHLQPRMHWTSIGFDGLAGRGRYPEPQDDGERWRVNFGHLLQPWRIEVGNRALILGQTPGDMATAGINLADWERTTAAALMSLGWQPIYRPHPNVAKNGAVRVPDHAVLSRETMLAADLDLCCLAVTVNSTAAVEAVLAGVATVTTDPGAVAWPVTAHALDALPLRPDRRDWCRRLAWMNWRPEEIADGTAWDAARTAMEPVH